LWKEKKRQYYSSKLYKTLRHNNKGWVCYCCGADNKRLDLHHRTYKRLGEENIAVDLVPVCRECHEKIHDYFKNNPVSLWLATKRVRKIIKYVNQPKPKKLKKTKQASKKISKEKRLKKLNDPKRLARLEKFKILVEAPENKF
jgi:YgiT-type zinc finger domain-containing protein